MRAYKDDLLARAEFFHACDWDIHLEKLQNRRTPIHKREEYDKLCEAIHMLVPCYGKDIAQELELHSLTPPSSQPLEAEFLVPQVARFIYDNEKGMRLYTLGESGGHTYYPTLNATTQQGKVGGGTGSSGASTSDENDAQRYDVMFDFPESLEQHGLKGLRKAISKGTRRLRKIPY